MRLITAAALLLLAKPVFAASALMLVPYEPGIGCGYPLRDMVTIQVTAGSEVSWNGQRITQKDLESYLNQERTRKPEARYVVRLYRDNVSIKRTDDLVRALKDAGVPFSKCRPVP